MLIHRKTEGEASVPGTIYWDFTNPKMLYDGTHLPGYTGILGVCVPAEDSEWGGKRWGIRFRSPAYCRHFEKKDGKYRKRFSVWHWGN